LNAYLRKNVHIILNVCKEYLVKIRKLQKVAVAIHCNLRPPNVAPVVMDFNHLHQLTNSIFPQPPLD